MAAQAKLEDSNIALLNSDLAKSVRAAAAATEKEWAGAGQKPGIRVWRVEKLAIKGWPEKDYGSFYSGDSYIVLHSYKEAESDKLLHNVHFWLGKDTSQDEAGVAAYKTVELDDLLGQLPVQFREVQGYESEEFLELFKPSIKIMDGGIDSGFNHVKPEEYKPRLLQVKGKKAVRVQQVDLKTDSLNQGDVFILDKGMTLIQWNGEDANVKEKRKAMDVVASLKEERNGKPKSKIIDGLEDDPEFWEAFGGKPASIKGSGAGGDDEKVAEFTKKLLKVSDASGKLTMSEVATGNISKSALDSNDVFIVDTESSIFVWIGAKASKEERGNAFKFANDYLVKAGRPFTTSVIRVVEGSHNKAFDAAFGSTFSKPK